MGELLSFSLLLVLEDKIFCHEVVNLAVNISGFNTALSIKKSGELNSGKLDSMGKAFSVCFGDLGLIFVEVMACAWHDFLRSICRVSSSFSVPLKPPWLPALAVKVNFILSFVQPSTLISCGICQFPGVKVILGLTILRFLVLSMLTRTFTAPLGFFVRRTPTDSCSAPDLACLASEIVFDLLNSMIFTPQSSSSVLVSRVLSPLP